MPPRPSLCTHRAKLKVGGWGAGGGAALSSQHAWLFMEQSVGEVEATSTHFLPLTKPAALTTTPTLHPHPTSSLIFIALGL